MSKLFVTLIFSLLLSNMSRSEIQNSDGLKELVEIIKKSEIAVIVDVIDGNKEISNILKGDIKKNHWITEGKYVYVGKPTKKQVLYIVNSHLGGARLVKIWQIKNGKVLYSSKINVEITDLVEQLNRVR